MPSDQDFLRIIQENPDEDAPKLIYADWLDDQGDLRGELIRLLVEVQSHKQHHEHWAKFERAVKDCFGTSDLNELIDIMDERQQRLFACQCAEAVIGIFEEYIPRDKNPRNAIDAARKYADGIISRRELKNARYVIWSEGWPNVFHIARACWFLTLPNAKEAAIKTAESVSRVGEYAARSSQLIWVVERLLEFNSQSL